MIRAFRWITTLLVAGLAALFIKQNMPTFSMEVPFHYDLYIRQKMMWYSSIGDIVLISLLIGVVAGLFVGIKLYWGKRREVNELKRKMTEEEKVPQQVSSEAGGTG
ncbi:LapA family protein [Thermodesulforhabdus norvegica]|uniref:Lipopolysaccharide assembly protein A domain-containing protein n=1 Tax=Thermodesulforhabdus norvegica TaxID=39841 RepID=A0A1I4S4Q4_9BACT|nr:LapA family protein [Thermodesulforhabdus norvegica]SFM59487.1 Protein of unknown function [Thermodesulforhabdus norvegica]